MLVQTTLTTIPAIDLTSEKYNTDNYHHNWNNTTHYSDNYIVDNDGNRN